MNYQNHLGIVALSAGQQPWSNIAGLVWHQHDDEDDLRGGLKIYGHVFKNNAQYPRENSSKKVVQYHVHKETWIRVGSVFAQKTDPEIDPLIGRFPEFETSDLAEIWRGGRYGNSAVDEWLNIPKDVRARI